MQSRKKAVLTDAEVLELIRLLPETWANVIKVCRVFGVRSWEVAFIARATNDDGEAQLRVTKGKTYNTAAGSRNDRSPVAGGRGCRWQDLRPGGGMGPTQAAPHRDRRPRGRPTPSALLAAADGRIRGPRRVAPAVLTAGHVLRAGSRDRTRHSLPRPWGTRWKCITAATGRQSGGASGSLAEASRVMKVK